MAVFIIYGSEQDYCNDARNALKIGNLSALENAMQSWNKPTCKGLMVIAANYGHLELVKYFIHVWHSTEIDDAIRGAIRYNQPHIVECLS